MEQKLFEYWNVYDPLRVLNDVATKKNHRIIAEIEKKYISKVLGLGLKLKKVKH